MGAWFDNFKASFILNFIEDDRYLQLLSGLWNTLIITFFATLIGLVLGCIVALVRTGYLMHIKEMKGYAKKSLKTANFIWGSILVCSLYVPVF